MLISNFDRHVKATDRAADKSSVDRLNIAIYGLNAEIGSVVAAVKKNLLATRDPSKAWTIKTDELIEELGDVLWYGFSLSNANNPKSPVNIFKLDIANIRKEMEANDQRAKRISGILAPEKREQFLAAATHFPRRTKQMEFEDYQKIAILTARTDGRTLVEVCVAVLWQLGAQLFRHTLPAVELELNTAAVHRPINDILGEIAWHIAALASVFDLKLSDIAQANIDKISLRYERTYRTPLHDEGRKESEQFPRHFEISIVSVGESRSRMYLDGRQLGDDLTDNSYQEDGYRYHDIMHLANIAKLGWSPVLRALMKRKRRLDAKIDEVEDGARAKIVEEAVIKSIHSEGARIAKLSTIATPGELRLFTSSAEITFGFLKFIRSLVVDLEVHKNSYWEWEEAILAGHEIFRQLHREGQGTVVVNLDSRSIDFIPEVCIELTGRVAGLGSAYCNRNGNTPAATDASQAQDLPIAPFSETRLQIQKSAVLASLGIQTPTADELAALKITEVSGKGISVKATGTVQRKIWTMGVVAFRTTITGAGPDGYICTAIALSDQRS